MNDAGQLIRNADLAMYRAKTRRDGEFSLYDPSMHASLVEKVELEAELRRAVRSGELHVHYQPTYTIRTGELVGVEALLRWTHPERGPIPPDVFIPLAEQTGLIHEIGRFVLYEACLQATRWHRLAPLTALKVGVNISGRQLQRDGFLQEVQEILEETGLAPEHLLLELTESVLMDDTEASSRTLAQLKDIGLKIAIDDFGTGYSSLSYLHRFPVDFLKIDRSLVERLSDVDSQESLVESIVQLAETMRLTTIAEGIEDHVQLLALRRLGCHMAKGYHLGGPGPPRPSARSSPIPTRTPPLHDPIPAAAPERRDQHHRRAVTQRERHSASNRAHVGQTPWRPSTPLGGHTVRGRPLTPA